MAESSRDTTQLIRLVYASICEGRGRGEVRWSEKCKKGNGFFFSPFFRVFFFLLIEWVLKVTAKTCLEYVAYTLNVMQHNDSTHFVTRDNLGKRQHSLQPDILPTLQITILSLKLK